MSSKGTRTCTKVLTRKRSNRSTNMQIPTSSSCLTRLENILISAERLRSTPLLRMIRTDRRNRPTQRRPKALAWLFVPILATCTFASANEETVPKPQLTNGIQFLAGGIDEWESRAMRANAHRFQLGLKFVEHITGQLRTNVRVVITNDVEQQLLNTLSAGPVFLVKLPKGWYTIRAQSEGQTETRRLFIIPDQHTRVTLYWPPRAPERM